MTFDLKKLLCHLVWVFTLLCSFLLTAQASEDYKLGPGDIIKITVFESPSLNSEERISESGNINIPMLGKLTVRSLTTDQAGELIARGFEHAGLLKTAHVSILVSQFMSRKVSVIGQVNHPGQFFLEKTSNIIDLLAMAGGVSQTGGDKAIIIRQVDGHEQKTSIDLYNILQVQQSNAPTITDGDIIFVPEADKFYIHGQVLKPGILKLEHNMTVLQAISAAGGVTPKGSENSVQLKRPDAQGNMQSINVELGELVHPNDIIYIPEGWF